MQNPRILLVNPPAHTHLYYYPPLNLGYLLAVVRQAGYDARILDLQFSDDYLKELEENLPGYNVLGITSNIFSSTFARHIAERAKAISPQTTVVQGGPMSTGYPEYFFPDYADYVYAGEGEHGFVDFLKADDPKGVDGIIWWDGEKKQGQRAPFVQDLDHLPYPDWTSGTYDERRYGFSHGGAIAGIMTSRGCPYQCIFCTKIVHGSKFRLRSTENILGEIDMLTETINPQEIHLWDDNFTFYPERVRNICQAIIDRKYKKLKLALPAGIRADRGDIEMFKIMKAAGFYWVSIAVESGDQQVVDKIGKALDLEKAKETFKSARKAGLRITAYFMLGLPFDTKESMKQTIEFARGLPCHEAKFHMTIPFPGTELYDMVEKEGKFLGLLPFQGAHYDVGEAIYEIHELKRHEAEKMFRRAFFRFWTHPQHLADLLVRLVGNPALVLSVIKRTFGLIFKNRYV